MTCNVLLLNLLIALMSSVYDSVYEKAEAQYLMDKTRLMLGLESIFISTARASAPRWLHVTGPKESRFWKSKATEVEELESKMSQKFDKAEHHVNHKFSALDDKLAKVDRQLAALIESHKVSLINDIIGGSTICLLTPDWQHAKPEAAKTVVV